MIVHNILQEFILNSRSGYLVHLASTFRTPADKHNATIAFADTAV